MIGQVFYDDEEYPRKAEWCNNNNCHIEEIERDENGRRFTIVENTFTEEEKAEIEIQECLKYLQDTDYITNKLAEAEADYIATGDNTEVLVLREHYAEELTTRKNKRERIRELENLLKVE
jgi:hypothetical protein